MPAKATRVTVLLALLAVAAFWAFGRTRSRHARTEWRRPVVVAVFVSGDTDPAAVEALWASLEAIGARLTAERDRYLPGRTGPALTFERFGPLAPERLPPTALPGAGWLDRVLHALAVWRAERAAFAAAGGFDPALADVRIHLVAAASGGGARFAEGLGAARGEVGIVRAAFDADDAFLAATAAVHEVLHCLGATDKYDAAGHAIPPGGLAEPGRSPTYPQRFAELMVGEVPVGPAAGRLPAGPHELAVGPLTASEIGWGGPAPGEP